MDLVTVFTPTFNRLPLLKRLYESLKEQTYTGFEWVIVDDDSSDGTEQWIDSITMKASFAIKYKRVSHGGKHRAINKGVQMAAGEVMFFVDSDDYLPIRAIETIRKWALDIKNIENIAGVAGLRQDPSGKIIGQCPIIEPDTYVECANTERYRMHLLGDKAEVYKIDVLKKYPFPEYEEEYFLTERVVWDRIAHDGYKIRWYNVPIYICEYQEEGLSNSGANQLRGHLDNYLGYVTYVEQSMMIMEPLEATTVFREYNYTAKKKNKTIHQRASDIGFSTIEYVHYLIIKMPYYYIKRLKSQVLG